jgi:HK97 family phage portal protein
MEATDMTQQQQKSPVRYWLTRIAEVLGIQTASSRAAAADVYPHHRTYGLGHDWTPTSYAEYYATSVPVYAAVTRRAEAMSRTPLTVDRILPKGESVPAGPDHELQRLLDHPNPWMTGAELRFATEANMNLWGLAYWSIEVVDGHLEIWPIRPDRLLPLPGEGRTYIKGYLYEGLAGDVAYLPREIVTFANYNPLQDRTGMSPIAPLRLSMDMAKDATRYNRQTFRNGGIPDYILFGEGDLTDQQVEQFYKRWEDRFTGPDKSHRPAIASGIRDMKSLAFSQREMEFIEGLRWSVEEASRVFGVPEPLLGRLANATLANVESLERIFWRLTMLPAVKRFEERIVHDALPKLGYDRGYTVRCDVSTIDVLTEQEEPRLARETAYLDRGVMTVNEVREGRGMERVAWGDEPTNEPD